MSDKKTASQPTDSIKKTDDATPDEIKGQHPETGEVGGPKGPEPTRYGDWEKKGRCIDF